MSAYAIFSEYMERSPRVECLYHFTDVQNLETIQELGLLSKRVMNAIGLEYSGAGSAQSRYSDSASGVEDYVSISLTDDHPMMFAAERDGRISKAVVLRIYPAILSFDQVVFCPTTANRKDAKFFSLDDAVKKGMVDFETLYKDDGRQYCSASETLRKCEILVPNCVPPGFIQF